MTAPAWTPERGRAIRERLDLLTGRTRTPDQLDLAAALVRINFLQQALHTYGRHASACAVGRSAKRTAQSTGYPMPDPGPCDCGLDAALAGTKENQ